METLKPFPYLSAHRLLLDILPKAVRISHLLLGFESSIASIEFIKISSSVFSLTLHTCSKHVSPNSITSPCTYLLPFLSVFFKSCFFFLSLQNQLFSILPTNPFSWVKLIIWKWGHAFLFCFFSHSSSITEKLLSPIARIKGPPYIPKVTSVTSKKHDICFYFRADPLEKAPSLIFYSFYWYRIHKQTLVNWFTATWREFYFQLSSIWPCFSFCCRAKSLLSFKWNTFCICLSLE